MPARLASNSRANASASDFVGDILPFGQLFERSGAETIEKLRIKLAHLRDHIADYGAGFARRVRSGAHAPQSVENDARDRMHHRGEGGHRQSVARNFNGALFGGAFNFLNALGMRHRADVPDVVEDGAGVGDQQG